MALLQERIDNIHSWINCGGNPSTNRRIRFTIWIGVVTTLMLTGTFCATEAVHEFIYSREYAVANSLFNEIETVHAQYMDVKARDGLGAWTDQNSDLRKLSNREHDLVNKFVATPPYPTITITDSGVSAVLKHPASKIDAYIGMLISSVIFFSGLFLFYKLIGSSLFDSDDDATVDEDSAT